MKKRNRTGRENLKSSVGSWLSAFGKPAKRDRRSWMFEQLEERNYFSATPYSGLVPAWSVSNSTAEGQQLVDALSQLWALQSSSGNQSGEVDAAVRAIPTDPALLYQWHIFNVGQVVNTGQFQNLYGVPGQDANVIPAWASGVSGKGINIAVVDSGVETTHPDLIDNISFQYAYNALIGGSNVSPGGDAHGTAVAGLIGASANSIGGVGVAYDANIIPIKLLQGGVPLTTQAIVNAINANGAPIDIFNHSWGPTDVGVDEFGNAVGNRGVDAVDFQTLLALTNSARLGRNGLGAIHVWAAGNGAEYNDSAGSDGYVNSRYTIAVGIVDHDGQRPNSDGTATNYGEMAPSVLIVAPSSSGPTDIVHNFATGSGIFTTDLTNNSTLSGGINVPPLPSGLELDIDAYPDDDYTSRFGGTSAAAPIVSGVIALMLEANPNLTYRDVEEILVRSARQNDDQDVSWVTNPVQLFYDPIRHYGDSLNDEIEWEIAPGEITEEAVQAKTAQLTSANGAKFSVHATKGRAFDGAAGNGITIEFDAVAGPPAVLANLVGTVITVTVSGTPPWSAIQNAVNAIQNGVFNFVFNTAADAQILFSAADGALTGTFADGADEVGESPTAVPVDPGYSPIGFPRTQIIPDLLYTNGAGYTVSYGRGVNATEYGYAHGVVDAGLAVELARQWHLKDQNLPAEKTWVAGGFGGITIRAAQATNEESGEFLIPGGLSNSDEGYIDYFNEFYKEPTVTEGDPEGDPPTEDEIDEDSLPFNGDDPPVNTRGQHITVDVPAIDVITGASNLISIEWVEVQLNITGGADAMNYLRITLVSPDGTHSELTQNHYNPGDINKSFQLGTLATGVFVGFSDSITAADENGTNSGALDWVYSTNRHWGERSDSAPDIHPDGYIVPTRFDETIQDIVGLPKGWELHFENYSGSDLNLEGATIAFHGTPIGSPAGPVERVMGKIGLDGGRYLVATDEIVGALDKQFNFDRGPDLTQEAFVGGATVYAIDTSTNQRVAEFVTGADGNYYFDLPAGEYKLGVEDPLGRTALANGANYNNEWIIQIDTTDGLTRTAGLTHIGEFDMNDDGVISPVEEAVEIVDFQYNQLNFLLDPGSLPPSEVVFTGQVIADLDGDGVQDTVDTGVYNFTVYADLNHTGQFEIGEPFVLSDLNGNYTLTVSTATPNTFTVGLKSPTGWETSFPGSGFHNEYLKPGDEIDGVKFLVTPPSSPSGEGPGTIFGFIFSDKNGNGQQDQNEAGLAGRTVYIDANTNGKLDDGEISVVSASSGAYSFGEVVVGTKQIRVVVNEPFVLTSPASGFRTVTIVAGQVSAANNFGIRNLAISDFGDLNGPGYRTREATSIVSQGFSLGSQLDTEIRPKNLMIDPASDPLNPTYIDDPTKDASGDDQVENEANLDDEDGVVLVGGLLRPGTNLFNITVNGVGGYLQGWFDFNKNGTFDSNEQVFTNLDINPGTHQLVINAPSTLQAGSVAARFRWGTANQTFFSADSIGEVEDYRFTAAVPIVGDFNADNVVDDGDYLLWKSTYGSTVDLRADGNKNGVIDGSDYSVWRDHMGQVAPSGSGSNFADAPAEGGLLTATAPGGVSSSLGLAELPSGDLSGLAAAQLPSGLPQNSLPTDSSSVVTPVAGAGSVDATSGIASISSLSLLNASFTTTVSIQSTSSVTVSAGPAAADIDAMLLLLASGLGDDATGESNLSGAGGLEWGKDESGQSAEFELAVATAFDDDSNWWLAL